MNWLSVKRIKQAFIYGWQDSRIISKETGNNRLRCFYDFFHCFKKYFVFSNQYFNNKLYLLPAGERELLAKEIGAKNRDHDRWVIENYENHKFLEKWTQKKWENTPKGSLARKKAYTEFFNTGKDLRVQYNVEIRREHFLFGTISIGNNVLLAKNVFIDYSGDLIIHDGVSISDGVCIETHSHSGFTSTNRGDTQKGHLEIGDHVSIGTKAIISESCHKIGRFAKIGAGAVVRSNVPAYAIVIGNPAKIIQFIFTPDEMVKFEKSRYGDDDKTSIESYARDYRNYYDSNLKKIIPYIKIKLT